MFIIFVIDGSSVGKISIKNSAVIRSKTHDFLGFLLIILNTSSSVVGLKVSQELSEDLMSEIPVKVISVQLSESSFCLI